MAVPYTFGSATSSIPLSQLDSNFATAITLGNTAVQLGNTITSLTGVSNVASAGALSLGSNGNTTAVTIDTSQNVGIGTTSPSARLQVTNTDGEMARFRTSSGSNQPVITISASDSAATVGFSTGGNSTFPAMTFANGGSERMRIDSSGNLQIGTTSNPQSTRLTLKYGTSANWGIGPTSNGSVFFVFNDSATGVQLTSGNQAWAAQSDERVKTDLVSIENGLTKVATLRAVVGKLKNDTSGRRLPFLIAQDVQAVLPEAVDTGEDEDATLSLRYSDVIPLLVASIKELKTLNDALTARIVALESK